MKSKLFLGGMFAFVAFVLINASSVHSAPAGTNVGGPIISDTTWTVAGSPYIVIANVDVLTGVTLTTQPGVVVKFNTGMILQMDGTLIAQGTSVNKITFTSNLPNPQPGDWGNIKFTDSSVDATYIGGNYISGSILHYCIVEYGGSTDTMTGAIETNSASPFIDHCIVRNNGTTGIHGGGTVSSPIVISNNTVIGNSTAHYGGAGIYAYFGTVTGNIVSANSDTGTPTRAAGYMRTLAQ